jgi:hypothetical protein
VPDAGFAVNLHRIKIVLGIFERLSNIGHRAIAGLQVCLGGTQILAQEALLKLARGQETESQDDRVRDIVKKLLAVAAERHLLFGTELPSLDAVLKTGGKSKDRPGS